MELVKEVPKTCNKCDVELVVGENITQPCLDNSLYICKPCTRKYDQGNYRGKRELKLAQVKAYADENREAVRENNRWAKIKHLYDLTQSGWNEIFKSQGGCCRLCDKHATEIKETLHVDHCHETGEVRGLLCKSCNSALGALGDNVEGLQKALDYLKGE